jgi:hypothetical protein
MNKTNKFVRVVAPWASSTIPVKSVGWLWSHSWDGHWSINEFCWKVIRGRPHYLLNRLPHSAQMVLANSAGFQIISQLTRLYPWEFHIVAYGAFSIHNDITGQTNC